MYRNLTIIALALVLIGSFVFAGFNYAPKAVSAGCCNVKATCCSCEKCVCENCKCSTESCCGEKCCKCGQDCKCADCKCKAGTCK